MCHTRGELTIIRSKKDKYKGQVFIKVKDSHDNFVCKFYSCPNGKEATDNIEHFLKSWYGYEDLLAACKKFERARVGCRHLIGHVISAHPLSDHVVSDLENAVSVLDSFRDILHQAIANAEKEG